MTNKIAETIYNLLETINTKESENHIGFVKCYITLNGIYSISFYIDTIFVRITLRRNNNYMTSAHSKEGSINLIKYLFDKIPPGEILLKVQEELIKVL
jgi:hypothetical protein